MGENVKRKFKTTDMNPQQLTNEQFALWMANQVTHSKLTNTADFLYDWLESKQKKPLTQNTIEELNNKR